jgi:Saxitoxin biosynthesis operon protein SxtJ
MSGHEPLQNHRAVKRGSNKVFGLVFAGFFLAVSLWPLVRHGTPRLWALGLALVFLVLALFAPHRLAAMNLLWSKLGLALNAIIAPIVLRILYFVILVPFAQILRWRGHDSLRLKRSKAASYWIVRDPAGPPAGTMKNQF